MHIYTLYEFFKNTIVIKLNVLKMFRVFLDLVLNPGPTYFTLSFMQEYLN